MKETRDIVRLFETHRDATFALATLVETRGSSYRRPGARMLIASTGDIAGSLSGGCLEEEVVLRARDVLRTGEPATMVFDTRRRFGCNGALEILLERVSLAFLQELADAFHARRVCCLAIDRQACRSEILSPESACVAELSQIIEPGIRLLLIGDGPDSAAFRTISHALGWSVEELENAAALSSAYDGWTAALVKTHNYGRDFAALRALLPLNLRYVGLLGPRARREQLLGDLLDTGLTPSPNLFAPAGLDLGGGTPEGVALSVIAEIQAVFAGGSRQSLRERKQPIHTPPPAAQAAAHL